MALERGDLEQAHGLYSELLHGTDPDTAARAHYMLAFIDLERDLPEDALDHLEHILRYDDGLPWVWELAPSPIELHTRAYALIRPIPTDAQMHVDLLRTTQPDDLDTRLLTLARRYADDGELQASQHLLERLTTDAEARHDPILFTYDIARLEQLDPAHDHDAALHATLRSLEHIKDLRDAHPDSAAEYEAWLAEHLHDLVRWYTHASSHMALPYAQLVEWTRLYTTTFPEHARDAGIEAP